MRLMRTWCVRVCSALLGAAGRALMAATGPLLRAAKFS
jgi:hypothetical protein